MDLKEIKKINSSLKLNSIYNLIGQLVPSLVGLFSVPILIKYLGTDRFGIITIVWMFIGYFSLFDMGLGRALTQLIAEKLGKKEYDDIPGLFWTSMSLMLALSIVGALIIVMLTPSLVHSIIKIPAALQSETISSLYLLAFSLPFVILTAALVGFLTAYNRFDIISAIRIPTGIYSYAAPLLILPFSSNLFSIISVLIVGRVITFFVYLRYCLCVVPELHTKFFINKNIIKPLVRFGGWMTVSNVIGPFMVYFDRFLIGSMISVSAVAFYATPYELVTKLWIIPTALVGVLFPAFASTHAQDLAATAKLLSRAIKYLLLVIFPIVLIIVACALEGLTLWLGATFAHNSYQVLQLLAIGVFINCLALVAFTFIQGIGKPDITTKFHVMELLIYLPTLWLLVKFFGIKGAALAWTLRVTFDAFLLFAAASRFCKPFTAINAITGYIILAAICSLTALILISPALPRYMVAGILMFSFSYVGWSKMLNDNERIFIFEKCLIKR